MHVLEICKVILMRIKLYRLFRAKKIAMKISQKETPDISFMDRLYYWNAYYLHCGCIKTHFRMNYDKPYMIKLFKIYILTTTAGTFPHYILSTILGFIGGIALGYAYFFMSVVLLDKSTKTAFYITAVLCIFLSIGMAFFEGVRCVILSVLPEICSSRTRAILITFAILLLISGPGANIMHNTEKLSDVMICTQRQVQDVGYNLTELYKKPLRIIKQGVVYLIQNIKPAVEQLKSTVLWIKNAIIRIGRAIKKVFSWFKIFSINCRVNEGSTEELCTKTVDKFINSCKANIPNILCQPLEIFALICIPFKAIGVVCVFKNFIEEHVFEYLKTKLKDLGHFLKTIFYVKVSFHHSYSFKTNQSKSFKEVFKEMLKTQEIRLQTVSNFVHIMQILLGMYIFYVIIKTFLYRYKFFYQDHFDNRHINKFLRELDNKRVNKKLRSLFPLTWIEKSRYVSLFSLRLTRWERVVCFSGSMFLFLAILQIVSFFVMDFFLILILELVNNHGRLSFHFGGNKSIEGTEGSGFFNTLYNLFNGIFNLYDIELGFDTGPCLPHAIPIDWRVYKRLAAIMLLACVATILQPFALRFRNYVMSHYYPDIARRRAVWLFNHILQTRGGVSQFVRRTLFTRGALGLRSERPNFFHWLKTRFPKLFFFLPFRNVFNKCTVCGYKNPTIRCATPECIGAYDKECFEILYNICLICNMPQNFKGLDVSEEEDSEGEIKEIPAAPKTQLKPWWKFWVQVSRTDSLVQMEEGEVGISDETNRLLLLTLPPKPSQPSTSKQQSEPIPKDYFGDEWRRDDWATLDDYEIPFLDMEPGTRPHFTSTIKTPLSRVNK